MRLFDIIRLVVEGLVVVDKVIEGKKVIKNSLIVRIDASKEIGVGVK